MTVSRAVEEFQSSIFRYIKQCEKFSHLQDYQFLYKSCEYVTNNLPVDTATFFVTDKRSALEFCTVYIRPLKAYYESLEENKITRRAKIDMVSSLDIFENDLLKSF